MMSAVIASWPRGELGERDRLAAPRAGASIAWSPISWPMLMLLRAWIGANDAAIASRLPE